MPLLLSNQIVKDRSRPGCFQPRRLPSHNLLGPHIAEGRLLDSPMDRGRQGSFTPSWIGLPYQPLATRGGFPSDETMHLRRNRKI